MVALEDCNSPTPAKGNMENTSIREAGRQAGSLLGPAQEVIVFCPDTDGGAEFTGDSTSQLPLPPTSLKLKYVSFGWKHMLVLGGSKIM